MFGLFVAVLVFSVLSTRQPGCLLVMGEPLAHHNQPSKGLIFAFEHQSGNRRDNQLLGWGALDCPPSNSVLLSGLNLSTVIHIWDIWKTTRQTSKQLFLHFCSHFPTLHAISVLDLISLIWLSKKRLGRMRFFHFKENLEVKTGRALGMAFFPAVQNTTICRLYLIQNEAKRAFLLHFKSPNRLCHVPVLVWNLLFGIYWWLMYNWSELIPSITPNKKRCDGEPEIISQHLASGDHGASQRLHT